MVSWLFWVPSMSNEDAYFVTNFSVTILTDCYLKSRRLLIAFDVSGQNHPRKRVIKIKDAKFILIGTYPFRIFLVFPLQLFLLEVVYSWYAPKRNIGVCSIWKLFVDYDFPLIFIFQSAFNSKCCYWLFAEQDK